MEYVVHVITLAALYTLLAQGLNFFSGSTRLLCLVHAGFYGLGAYGWAVAAAAGIPLPLAILVGLATVIGAAVMISWAAFRTKEEYFVIVTLAMQMLIFDVLNNADHVTNGPAGISDIPQLGVGHSKVFISAVAIGSACVAYVLFLRLIRSAWGRSLVAIRDDELMMSALGKPVVYIKTASFVLCATLAGYAGTLFAQYATFINPTSFSISESIAILSMVIVGGFGNVHGVFWATIFLVSLPEFVRFLGLPGIAEGNAREIIYGTALIGAVLLRHRAMGSDRARSLHGKALRAVQKESRYEAV